MSAGNQVVRLENLVQRINEEHAAAETAINAALQHAVNAGRLLNEAKALVGHGEWRDWLLENFAGSERTAQGYMRVAGRLPELEAKAQRVADLSLRQALGLLARPSGAAPERNADTEDPASELAATVAIAVSNGPPLVPPPGHALLGTVAVALDGRRVATDLAIIEPAVSTGYYFVSHVSLWDQHQLPENWQGDIVGTAKPVRWDAIRRVLAIQGFPWWDARCEWETIGNYDEPDTFNVWLFGSVEETAKHRLRPPS